MVPRGSFHLHSDRSNRLYFHNASFTYPSDPPMIEVLRIETTVAHLITSLYFFVMVKCGHWVQRYQSGKRKSFYTTWWSSWHTPQNVSLYLPCPRPPSFLLYSRTRSGFTFYSPVMWWTFSVADIIDVWTAERTWTSLLSGCFITNCLLFTLNSTCPSVNADVPPAVCP